MTFALYFFCSPQKMRNFYNILYSFSLFFSFLSSIFYNFRLFVIRSQIKRFLLKTPRITIIFQIYIYDGKGYNHL